MTRQLEMIDVWHCHLWTGVTEFSIKKFAVFVFNLRTVSEEARPPAHIIDEVPCGRTVLFLARISLYLDLRDTIFSHSWSRIDNIWAILDNISSFLSSSLVLYLSVQTESVRIDLGLQDYTVIGLWRSIYGNYGTRKQSVKKRQRQNLAFVSSFYYFWIMSITAIVWCKTISVYL